MCLVHQHIQRHRWNAATFGAKQLLNRIEQHIQQIRTKSKAMRNVPSLNYRESLSWQYRTIRLAGTEISSLFTLVKCAISSLMTTWNQDFRVDFTSTSVQASYQCLYRKCPSDRAGGSQYKQKLNDFSGWWGHCLAPVMDIFAYWAAAQSEINGILEWINRLLICNTIGRWAHKYHSRPLPQNWWCQYNDTWLWNASYCITAKQYLNDLICKGTTSLSPLEEVTS